MLLNTSDASIGLNALSDEQIQDGVEELEFTSRHYDDTYFSPPLNSKTLKASLEGRIRYLCGRYGVSGGIVYLPDYRNSKLQFFTGEEHNVEYTDSQEDISVSYKRESEESFAREVFWSASPVFVKNVDNAEGNHLFDNTLRRNMGISGSVLGVPLRLQARCFGILIVWSKNGALTDENSDRHHVILHQAKLMAANVASTHERRRKFVLTGYLGDMIGSLSRHWRPDAVFSSLQSAAMLSGTDTTRIFKYSQKHRNFVWTHSISRIKSIERFENNEVVPPSSYKENPYLVESLRRNNATCFFDASKDEYLEKVKARSHKILDPGEKGLPAQAFLFTSRSKYHDPFASMVGRPRNIPWILAPMIFNGVCVGFVSADNRKTGRSIDTDIIRFYAILAYLTAATLCDAKPDHPSIEFALDQYISRANVTEPVDEPSPHYAKPRTSQLDALSCSVFSPFPNSFDISNECGNFDTEIMDTENTTDETEMIMLSARSAFGDIDGDIIGVVLDERSDSVEFQLNYCGERMYDFVFLLETQLRKHNISIYIDQERIVRLVAPNLVSLATSIKYLEENGLYGKYNKHVAERLELD
ncbi:MAG: hypothetical protein ABJV68_05190 [Paracoccaceae bacterium]